MTTKTAIDTEFAYDPSAIAGAAFDLDAAIRAVGEHEQRVCQPLPYPGETPAEYLDRLRLASLIARAKRPAQTR